MPLNEKQQRLVDSIDGIYVVDAGAGTGKTTAITKRYEKILEKVPPDQILMLTFTENAAENMRQKIINECSNICSIRDLKEAPISTFHSFCNSLLKNYGFNVPRYMGLEGNLYNYNVMENEIYEQFIFRRFFNEFQERHPQYRDFYVVLEDNEVLSIIKRLCCKGIFPTNKGWFLNGEDLLKGNFGAFMRWFNKKNEFRSGSKKSALARSFETKLENNIYILTPDRYKLFDNGQINPEMAVVAFNENRKQLFQFIHDVYLRYINFCLKINRINFDFMVMFAFILLYFDHELRQDKAFQYVMIDEFQDTDEIQFMMTLLMMKTNNLCAVGDWKQGIYGFRNANIQNILDFKRKIQEYKDVLNSDYERIKFDVQAEILDFDINYRSSQYILRSAERSLLVSATRDETIDDTIADRIVHLKANFDLDDMTGIEFIQAEEGDEYDMILAKVQDVVGRYKLKDFKDDGYVIRDAKYADIAILSRRRDFGLELMKRAIKYGIPANYDGGIELFRTEPAILLLAWLRIILNVNDAKGWVPILEREGYKFLEIQTILEDRDYPEELIALRKELLKQREDISFIVGKILKYYGFSDSYSNALIREIDNLFNSSTISVSELINLIRENIETHQTYDIDISRSTDALTIQTIHGSKGLEYPIVFIVDVNERHFPAVQREQSSLIYHDLVGIRLMKHYGQKNGYKYIFNKWETDLITTQLFSDYDEERRLLYVAMTRAKQYIIFTAGKAPSLFFTKLAEVLEKPIEKGPTFKGGIRSVGSVQMIEGEVEEITIDNYKKLPTLVQVMSFAEGPDLNSKEFRKALDEYAYKIAMGLEVNWDIIDAYNISNFIKKLNATELKPALDCMLPIGDIVLMDKIDLLAFYDDNIQILGYKSDHDLLDEQFLHWRLSIHYHVVKSLYPERSINCRIYFTTSNEVKEVIPASLDVVKSLLLDKLHLMLS